MMSHLVLLILKLFTCFVTTGSITQDVFLNSYTACGINKMYPVSYHREYVVKPDISPKTKSHTFRDCEMTFHSAKEKGRICLMQTGNVGMISDPNVELEAKDGLGDSKDELIDRLQSGARYWAYREYCSTTEYITLYLSERRKTQGADIRKVNIEFRVVGIESPSRTIYLDGAYCSQHYQLFNSVVTLWNRPQFPGMYVTMLTSECGIRFDRIGGQRNTSICFAFIPSENMRCDSQWRFAISISDFDLDEEYILYSLRCNDTQAKKIHVWCADKSVDFLTVIFWRGRNNILSNSTIEPSETFQYLVMDYKGTEESLLTEMEGRYGKSSSGALPQWMIYAIAAVGVVFVITVIVICCKRRKRYKPVNQNNEETASKAV